MYGWNHASNKLWARMMASKTDPPPATPWENSFLVLLASPVAVNPLMTPADIPQPAFTGYDPIEMTADTPVVLRLDDGTYAIQMGLHLFTATTPMAENVQVFGWAVIFEGESGQPQCVYVENFADAFTFSDVSPTLAIAGQLKIPFSEG